MAEADPSARPPAREDRNARTIVTSLTLTKAGDAVVDAKAVLPYLLAAGGAPAFLTGLLVPVRESGSLLPQAVLAPRVQRVERRRYAWSLGAVGQAVAVLAMAVAAATATGLALGVGIVGALAVFALSRALSSISFKDTLGRAVGPGRRGRVTGRATSAAGAIALTLGVGLRLLGDQGDGPGGPGGDTVAFAWLLVAAAAAWLLAALLFLRVDERPEGDGGGAGATSPWALARDDRDFRHFVVARTLLLASALAPPLVVQLAVEATGGELAGLGPFVVASGLAALLGGRAWGSAADRSSRLVMARAAGLAAVLVAGFLVALGVGALDELLWTYVLAHFLLQVVHAGARVGRSTYVVDVAEGDRRTAWVAASNSAMGVLLLVVGGAVGAVATADERLALWLLVGVGIAGVVASSRLPRTAAEAAHVEGRRD